MKLLRVLVRLIGVFLLLLGAAALVAAWVALRPIPMSKPVVDFDIAPGMSMKRISAQLADAGLDIWPAGLTMLARFNGDATRIKAGSYRIDKPVNMLELVALMSSGANAYADLTIVEGWTFARLRLALASHPDLKQDSAGLDEADIMARIGFPGVPAEGMFAPDTYSFSRGASDFEVLRRAAQHMQLRLEQAWSKRAADVPLKTPYEALVLASVVEKETGRADDRLNVASVFVNRLRIGMPLQSDPTVIYGLGSGFDGNLRRRDLQADTPFNSYTRRGLPPTPISLPGKAALEATLNPAQGKFLYFVARGDGTSAFSSTLDEHNRAVARYQRAGK
ncbi:endolytic transglycosylase MltG [Uliginosibacterium paludis]|uniref:Endolytic murein transglycosylase n=1 Tax=Uliginosibacterium paludis TaxID=1615952 RepID=A0ABV2CTT7_9RHOO